MKAFLLFLFLSIFSSVFSQVLPDNRSVDWSLAGLRDTTTTGFQLINMQNFGAVGDSVTPNDTALSVVINSLAGSGAVLEFQNGNFLFNNTINLPSNIIIKGQGVGSTAFIMDLSGIGNAVEIKGNSSSLDTVSISQTGTKDSSFFYVNNTTIFSSGDWIQIVQQDADLVTSTWAHNSVGQVVQIDSVIGNKITLKSPLRMDYVIARSPRIRKINTVKNVGIECLKIFRVDDTAPQQTSTVYFKYAVNCWIKGVETENCTYSHVQARKSANIYISKSYFHHAFDYGAGGRGNGVMLHLTSNECLVEDNVFEHLRHSMIVQAGANGNVFTYNYSFDPFWTSTPSNSAGDLVLHGNYPYANLFEQNICRNIVIDDSHGPNGPYNTFFRNRAEGFGIFFSASNSPNQNFIGNDIPNTTFPYNLVNYSIAGTGHFLHGNNNKGNIDPVGTQVLSDLSYMYASKPNFVPQAQWAAIGTPNNMGANNIPAYDRYSTSTLFDGICNNINVSIKQKIVYNNSVVFYPNPVSSSLTIKSDVEINKVTVVNVFGQHVSTNSNTISKIKTDKWAKGVYVVTVEFNNGTSVVRKVVKE